MALENFSTLIFCAYILHCESLVQSGSLQSPRVPKMCCINDLLTVHVYVVKLLSVKEKLGTGA